MKDSKINNLSIIKFKIYHRDAIFLFFMTIFMVFPHNQIYGVEESLEVIKITQDFKPLINDFLTNYIKTDTFKKWLISQDLAYNGYDFYKNLISSFIENLSSITIPANTQDFDSIIKKVLSDFEFFVSEKQKLADVNIPWGSLLLLIILRIKFYVISPSLTSKNEILDITSNDYTINSLILAFLFATIFSYFFP